MLPADAKVVSVDDHIIEHANRLAGPAREQVARARTARSSRGRHPRLALRRQAVPAARARRGGR